MKWTILIAMVVGLASCKDHGAPTVEVVAPVNHSAHEFGSAMHVEAEFADDQELASYHVWIGDEEGNAQAEWPYGIKGTLSGKNYSFHEMVHIPDSISEVYWLHFDVMDSEGQQTMEKVMIHLQY